MDKMDKMNKFIGSVIDIQETKPTAEQIAYMTRQLILTSLPHSDPKTPNYYRKNGNVALDIVSGAHEGKMVGVPYGSIPRLLLIWATSEALKTQSRYIHFGRSMHDFMKQLDMSTNSRAGNRLKDQAERLFRANITITERTDEYIQWKDLKISSGGKLWFSDPNPKIIDLFKSEIELSQDYYDMITDAPVPLDMRAIDALKKSPLGLDLYAWLSWRSFTLREAKKPLFVPLEALKRQLGADYKNQKDFNEKIRRQLLAVRALGIVDFETVTAVKGKTKAGITIKNRGKLNIQSLLT